MIRNVTRKVSGYIRNEMQELKSTRWTAELLKNLCIFMFSSIITTSILYGLRKQSSGEMTGDELEKYMCNKVMELCEKKLEAKNVKVEIPYAGEFRHLSDSRVIVGYGSYNTKSTEKEGRVIVFFKKKEKSLINDILGIAPSYTISSAYFHAFEAEKDYLNYVSLENDDYDNDGKNEIMLQLRSNFADRIDNVYLLFAYYDNKWKLVENDTRQMLKLVSKSTKDKRGACIIDLDKNRQDGIKKKVNINLHIDKYEFTDVMNKTKKYDIYGLYNDGCLMQSKNPLTGGCEFSYKISYGISGSFDTGVLYMMQQFKKGKLSFENNWNNGYPMITDDKFDFEKNSWKYWGYDGNIDGNVFYGLQK